MSMYPGTGEMCPNCYKPWLYIGDVATGGFPPGDEPWCTCQTVAMPQVESTDSYIQLDPVLGELKSVISELIQDIRYLKEEIQALKEKLPNP